MFMFGGRDTFVMSRKLPNKVDYELQSPFSHCKLNRHSDDPSNTAARFISWCNTRAPPINALKPRNMASEGCHKGLGFFGHTTQPAIQSTRAAVCSQSEAA
jgi:hypothetical protein